MVEHYHFKESHSNGNTMRYLFMDQTLVGIEDVVVDLNTNVYWPRMNDRSGRIIRSTLRRHRISTAILFKIWNV